MLTPTDVHLIVGSFCKMTTPDKVDITLGEMVYDRASRRKRDIDIGIKYYNELDEEVLFVGLQVKDHTRKLGSPEVEQLCLHFKDSEGIKRGGIVSSSGYTRAGIRKANYHGVDLYEFRDYDPQNELNHVRFKVENFILEVVQRFVDTPQVNFLFGEEDRSKIKMPIGIDSPISQLNGDPIEKMEDLDALTKVVVSNLLNEREVNELLDKAELDEEIPITLTKLINNVHVILPDANKVELKGLVISGVVSKVSKHITPKLKILSKLGDPSSNVGGAICELSNGMLFCLTTSDVDRSLKLLPISLTDRLRNKINNIKIKSNPN